MVKQAPLHYEYGLLIAVRCGQSMDAFAMAAANDHARAEKAHRRSIRLG
jgi:hypothetical protein